MNRDEARRLYRKLHPRRFPFSAFERQRELDDLWPVDQDKFIREMETAVAEYDRLRRLGPDSWPY